MAKASVETWDCPLCSLQRMPYGTTCTDFDCRNLVYAHITGQWYLKQALDSNQLLTAVGIAAISDEDITNRKTLKREV